MGPAPDQVVKYVWVTLGHMLHLFSILLALTRLSPASKQLLAIISMVSSVPGLLESLNCPFLDLLSGDLTMNLQYSRLSFLIQLSRIMSTFLKHVFL